MITVYLRTKGDYPVGSYEDPLAGTSQRTMAGVPRVGDFVADLERTVARRVEHVLWVQSRGSHYPLVTLSAREY